MNTTETYSANDYVAMVARKDKVVTGAKKNDFEHIMQCQIVDDFDKDHPDYAGLLYAIPNGAKLPYHKDKKGNYTSPQRIKLVAEGMRPGVPDLHLPVARGGWLSLYVECKVLPNQPTDDQINMMARLTAEGHYCQVVYTAEQATELFANYLSL